MNTRQMMKLLGDQMQLQEELLEFIEQCLRKMYGEEGQLAVNNFNDDLNFYDYNGCLQSLCCIDRKVTECRERAIKLKSSEV